MFYYDSKKTPGAKNNSLMCISVVSKFIRRPNRSNLSMGANLHKCVVSYVRTHYIIVQRSNNIYTSHKIKQNQLFGGDI